jgi:signal transduction histidine kinase
VLNGYSSLLVDDQALRRDPDRVEHALLEMRSHLATLNDISQHLADAVGHSDRPPRLDVVFADVDLAAAAAEAVAMARDSARRHGVRLRLDSAALRRSTVRGDRFRLVTAMRNLLDNACAHGPDGGEVVVELTEDGEDVEVRVHDQGSGLGRLGGRAFQPLRRGEPEGEGLGLGLSLVAEVARAHCGRVLWGRDRRGAHIGLRFPRHAHA